MAPRKKKDAVDMEVQLVQEVRAKEETETPEPPKPPVEPETPEPPKPEVDREIVRLQVEFHRIDKIMTEVEAGKAIEKAIQVDAKLAEIFETKDIVARDTRNSFYHLFKKSVVPKATANVDGVWTQPVSYSIV